MSIKTWCKEFYSNKVESRAAQKDPVAHSLRKWTGLLKKNLKKHQIHQGRGLWSSDDYEWRDTLYDDEGNAFDVDDQSCALCRQYISLDGCEGCPLVTVLGHPCDRGDKSPYSIWVYSGDARPMIRALKKAKGLS